jgi:hypothetical protein
MAKDNQYLSPQIKNSAAGLYRYFNVSFRFFINHKSSAQLNIIKLDALVSSSTVQIFTFFSLQLCDVSILLKYRYFQTKINTPPCCRF